VVVIIKMAGNLRPPALDVVEGSGGENPSHRSPGHPELGGFCLSGQMDRGATDVDSDSGLSRFLGPLLGKGKQLHSQRILRCSGSRGFREPDQGFMGIW